MLLAGRHATDAYLLAGYKSRNRASAQAASSRLLRHPCFAAYYGELRRRADAHSRRRTLRAIQRELRLLKRIIQTSASAVPPPDRKLIESQKIFRQGGRVTRLPCKLTALRRHTKLSDHLHLTHRSSRPTDPNLSKNPLPFITFPPPHIEPGHSASTTLRPALRASEDLSKITLTSP